MVKLHFNLLICFFSFLRCGILNPELDVGYFWHIPIVEKCLIFRNILESYHILLLLSPIQPFVHKFWDIKSIKESFDKKDQLLIFFQKVICLNLWPFCDITFSEQFRKNLNCISFELCFILVQKFNEWRFIIQGSRNMLEIFNVYSFLRIIVLIDGHHGIFIEFLQVLIWLLVVPIWHVHSWLICIWLLGVKTLTNMPMRLFLFKV